MTAGDQARVWLTSRDAAFLASRTLGYDVAPSTVRWWKHRGKVTGGPGWFDRDSLLAHVLHLKQLEPPS